MSGSDLETIQALRSDVAMQIARRLRDLRLTQTKAARQLDIPQPTLSKIANGHVADLSLELLIRTAVRIGLPLVLQTGRVAEEAGAYVTRTPATPVAAAPRSKLADWARNKLIEASKKLTPEQRLNAMLEQSQLISELHAAGRQR